jgi:hypothetical protein
MKISRFFPGTYAVTLAFVAFFASFSAQGAAPLPTMADLNLQTCLTEQANRSGWQYAEEVTQLDCSGRGVVRLEGIEGLSALAALDLSKNEIQDALPLSVLHNLTKLNLSGNGGIDIMQVRLVLDTNYGLTSLGLNGIRVGAFSNLGALFNPMTGRPYDLVELDLGNTGLTDPSGNGGLDFLQPYSNLVRLNVAGNGIRNILVLGMGNQNFAKLAELDLSNNAFVDVSPLWALHNLTKLNLVGDTRIACVDLDNLAVALPNTSIQRPASCVGANVLPVANAGTNQTVKEGSPVMLSGSGTDSDGTIVSYAWVQIAGPAVTLSTANSAKPTFTAPQVTANTVLTFRLTVTDNSGGTGSATTNVNVLNVSGVDLAVTAVGASVTTVRRGSSFSMTSTTKNSGDRATSTSTTTGLYLSTDATVTAGDVLVGTVSVARLGAGASLKTNRTVTVPRTLRPGTYYLGAIADYTKRQSELNESNNSATGITIRVMQ